MAGQTASQVTRMSIDEVRHRMNEVVFVDARSATALSRNPLQIPGAIHVPVKQLETAIKLLPRKRTLLTYCT